MDAIRWGVIGIGRFGIQHAHVAASTPTIQLVAICNRNLDKLAGAGQTFPFARQFTDWHELLDSRDIDAVSVTTHWRDHAVVAVEALQRGKHVLLEKPMASNIEECQRVLETAATSTGLLMVGHICRFDPRITLAKQAVDEGRIGRIVSLRSKRNLPVAPGAIRLDKISPLMGDGIHDADLMMWFLGRAPSKIYGAHLRVGEFQYPDIGWAVLHFGSDAIGFVEANWRLPANVSTVIDAELEIVGTDGKIRIDSAQSGLTILDAGGQRQPDTVYWPMQNQSGRPAGALASEMAYFADCIRRNEPPQVMTPIEAARAVATMECADRSALEGRPLNFSDPFSN